MEYKEGHTMLWDVDLISLLGISMILLMGVSILTMAWVVLRRMIRHEKIYQLTMECEWYQSTVVAILEGRFWGDPKQLRKRPGTVEWKAIERLLLEKMGSSTNEQQKRLIAMFEQLGYAKFYTEALCIGASWKRGQAALRLGQMRSSEATPFLIKILSDPDQNVRQRAVQALGRVQDPKAIQALVEQVTQWTAAGPEISREVLKTSIIGHGEKAISMLLPLLLHPHDEVRILTAEILAESPSVKAVASLIKSLSDPHPEVRARAACALGRIRHPLGVKPLISMLLDPFWYVRLQSAQSLGEIGSPRAVFGLFNCLGDSHWRVRAAAARSLMEIGPIAIEALTTYLLYTRDRYAGQQIAEVLQRSGLLAQWIQDLVATDSHTAERARNILGALARNFLLDSLVTAARRHSNRQIRLRLAEILSKIINLETSKVLRQISLYDSDLEVRTVAQDALSWRLRHRQVFGYAGNCTGYSSVG
jgi:HEAT repeat protein